MPRLSGAWGRVSSRFRRERTQGPFQSLRVSYDPDSDALSIALVPSPRSAKTVEIDDARYVDLDHEGKVVAIEVLWVSRGFTLRDIVERFQLWDYEKDLKEVQNQNYRPVVAL